MKARHLLVSRALLDVSWILVGPDDWLTDDGSGDWTVPRPTSDEESTMNNGRDLVIEWNYGTDDTLLPGAKQIVSKLHRGTPDTHAYTARHFTLLRHASTPSRNVHRLGLNSVFIMQYP